MTSSHKHYHLLSKNTALYAALFIALFGCVEILASQRSGSLALLSDAGHSWIDALTLILSAFASWFKQKRATKKYTYGFGRIEILVSWLSCIILLMITINTANEAIHHLYTPSNIVSEVVIIIAIISLIINIITAWILCQGEMTLNIHTALLHVLGDAISSIAVLISGTIIYFTNWTFIDSIISLFICILITTAVIRLLKELWLVLMETTPKHIDYNQVKSIIENIVGVDNIHDLHIWTITSNIVLLTVHIVVYKHASWEQIIDDVRTVIRKNFNITHSTVQIETQKQITENICSTH
ncbi:MAG: cation diffusion facilitator family transporter [Coxiellaceae bacterium]|jgi:cobalt-zinc-cadmium efflux system protein|nr:cation diffusion facilitator family transporter [Coxiellaceae bacterium]